MKKNYCPKHGSQPGLTLLELLIAFALFAVFVPAVIIFTRTAVSNNNNLNNQTLATNQLKNAFNYISADTQMAGMVTVTNPTSTPSNFPVTLSWIDYPSDIITANYTILGNGNLQRVYTDAEDSTQNNSKIVATNVNSAQTNCTWIAPTSTTSGSLSINLFITIGTVTESRSFQITPRVAQISAQLPVTITGSSNPTSPAKAIWGSSVTFTASFNQNVNSGTVSFLDSASPIPIGTAPVLSTHTATCTVVNLAVGVHQFSAVFSGDATYATSTSASWTLEVIKVSTSTVLGSVPSTISPGGSAVFSATVSPAAATGTVEFTSNVPGDSLDVTFPVVAGVATTTSETLSSITGIHTITATYSGDTDYAVSSGTFGITVRNQDPILTSISPTSCNVSPALDIILTANGSNFVSSASQIYFNGIALTTTFVNSNQLTAVISHTNSLLQTPNNFSVIVQTVYAQNTSSTKYFAVIGPPSAAQSTLTVSPSPANNILADGVTAATLIVTAKDSAGNNCGVGGAIVVFSCSSGTANLGTVTDVLNGTYTTTAASTTLGTCTFTATINSGNVGGGASVQVIFVVGNTITVNSNTLWSALTGGTGTGLKPSAADKIIVGSNKTLTVDVSTAVANSVTLGTGNGNGLQGQLTFNSGSQLVVGTLSRNSNQTCNVTMTNGGILVVTTSWAAGTGLTLVPGTGSINFGGAGNQTLPSDITTYNNLATVGSVTAAVGANTTVNGTLTVSNGTSLNVGAYSFAVTGATTVGSGTSGTLTISSPTGSKTFGGLVTVNSGATWNNSANEAVTFKGGIACTGTFTAGSAVQTFSTNAQILTGNLTIPSVTVTGITLTNNGTLTVTTALIGTGTLSNAGTGVLNIGGTSTISNLNVTASGNTVNYNGSGAQTVFNITYSNLILSGSGAKTIGAATNGTLTTGTFSIDPTGTATASITNKNIGVYTLVIVGSTKSIGTWGYGPANPPANRDTAHFSNTSGYVTSSH
jgi:Bacterial Ig-like domain (group 3)